MGQIRVCGEVPRTIVKERNALSDPSEKEPRGVKGRQTREMLLLIDDEVARGIRVGKSNNM